MSGFSMKRVSQLTALALAFGLACASSRAADTIQALNFQQLQQAHGTAIDTRPSAFYNGWPQTLNGPSGHEPAALNLSASWLDDMNDKQIADWVKQHQLNAGTPVALYGSEREVQAVEARLRRAGLTQLTTLSDALQEPTRLQRLPHFEQLVYPRWLHNLQQGRHVTAAPAGKWRVLEAGWGAPKLYLLSHIPGADYIDTNEVESEPLWNKVSDAQLKVMLEKHGIRHDTTVILYGRDVYAAARVAQIMLYAGVKDVRLLDGGWRSWSDAKLPVERGTPAKVQPEPDFGVTIPARPQLMLNIEQARALLHRQDASLVSIRSWPEFIGTTSGYSYIKPKGEIAGARWGHAGSDSTHMEDFHNPDGTMRSADDITAMWKTWNIRADQQVSFYCGTGWRASETFMYARAMGWPNISVYDGGWYEWSSDSNNPVVSGERGPESSL
jgi:3-mercaptopyruvate sulfurtransferase SseA